MIHFVPFHLSATDVLAVISAAPVPPTAVHAVNDVQDTPSRPTWYASTGLGVDWMAHFVPFHLSASETVVGPPEELYPTAVHVVAPVHDIPARVV
jgi:hypothetical protein